MLWPFGKGRSSAGVKETDRHGHGLLNLQRSSYLHPVSFIPGRANASPSNTQGGSPVRESRPPGSVRGAPSNGCPYRDVRTNVRFFPFGVVMPIANKSAEESDARAARATFVCIRGHSRRGGMVKSHRLAK